MCSGSLPLSTSAACTAGGGGGGAGLGANGALDDDGGLEGGRCGGDRAAAAAPVAVPAAALGAFGDGRSFEGFGLDFGEGRILDACFEEDCLADGLLLSIDLDASCAACCGVRGMGMVGGGVGGREDGRGSCLGIHALRAESRLPAP